MLTQKQRIKFMQKELLLHLGFHKTGSTSIQETCAKNIEMLKEMDISYPLFKHFENENKSSNHSIFIYSLFTDKPDTYTPNKMRKLDTKMANKHYLSQFNKILKSNTSKLILSGESLSTLKQHELKKLKTHIESAGWNIRTIIYLRSPLSSAPSVYGQRIKAGKDAGLLENEKLVITRIKTILKIFPQAIFYPFKKVCSDHGGPAQHFLSILKITDTSRFEFIHANESLSNQAIRLIPHINKSYPTLKGDKVNDLRKVRDTFPIHQIKGEKFSFNEEEYYSIKDELKVSNDWLNTNLGPDFCDSNTDFKPIECKWTDTQLDAFESIMLKLPTHILHVTREYFEKKANLTNKQLKRIKEMYDKDFDSLNACKEILQNHVEQLRGLALKIEKYDLQKAYNLMELAHLGRPEGTIIYKELIHYKKELEVLNRNA